MMQSTQAASDHSRFRYPWTSVLIAIVCLVLTTAVGCDFFGGDEEAPKPVVQNKQTKPVTKPGQTPTAPGAKTAPAKTATAPPPAKAPEAAPAKTATAPPPATAPETAPAKTATAPPPAKAPETAPAKTATAPPPAKAPETAPAKAPTKTSQGPPAKAEEETVDSLMKKYEAMLAAYTFKPENLADPFRPIAAYMAQRPGSSGEAEAAPLTPLQKMELSQVKLVAVVSAGANSRALVEDSTGTGYIIQIGTAMGRREGKVVTINPESVEVEESVKDYLGNPKSLVTILKLYPIEGEKK